MPSLKTSKAVPLFLGLLLLAAGARAERLTARFDKTIPLKPGGKLEILNRVGAVHLEAWDRNEVRIEAERWAEAKRRSVAQQALDRIRIEVSPTQEGLRVLTHLPDVGFMDVLAGRLQETGVTFRVRVPRQAVINAESSNGALTLAGTRGRAVLENVHGPISVNGAGGELNLVSVTGEISLKGASAGIRAVSFHGGIKAELDGVPHNLHFETVNGGVELRLPAATRMTLEASMEAAGAVRSDFQVVGANPKTKNVLKGTVNGGGKKVHIRTINGGIKLSKL